MDITVPDVIEDFRAYYEANPSWGSLHIVLEDINVEDRFVRFCMEDAAKRGDVEGERLAKVLLGMSKSQRKKIAFTT